MSFSTDSRARNLSNITFSSSDDSSPESMDMDQSQEVWKQKEIGTDSTLKAEDKIDLNLDQMIKMNKRQKHAFPRQCRGTPISNTTRSPAARNQYRSPVSFVEEYSGQGHITNPKSPAPITPKGIMTAANLKIARSPASCAPIVGVQRSSKWMELRGDHSKEVLTLGETSTTKRGRSRSPSLTWGFTPPRLQSQPTNRTENAEFRGNKNSSKNVHDHRSRGGAPKCGFPTTHRDSEAGAILKALTRELQKVQINASKTREREGEDLEDGSSSIAMEDGRRRRWGDHHCCDCGRRRSSSSRRQRDDNQREEGKGMMGCVWVGACVHEMLH